MLYRHGSRPTTDPHPSTTVVTSPNSGPWGPQARSFNPAADIVPPPTAAGVVYTCEWPGARYLHAADNGQPACGDESGALPVAVTDDGDAYPCYACYGDA